MRGQVFVEVDPAFPAPRNFLFFRRLPTPRTMEEVIELVDLEVRLGVPREEVVHERN